MRHIAVVMFLMSLAACAQRPNVLPACRCARSQNPVAWDYRRADYVFVGMVVGVHDMPDMSNPPRRQGPQVQEVQFTVSKQFKGQRTSVALVYTDRIWDCSYPFILGETYLVYAWKSHRFNDKLETSACIRTKPVQEADEDLLALPKVMAQRTKEQ